jgi:hypothetical protein
MSKPAIEVRVHARGSVKDGDARRDESVEARCDLCGATVDAVASVGASGSPYACKSCLRERLESVTVALFLLKEPREGGLPWGKISG